MKFHIVGNGESINDILDECKKQKGYNNFIMYNEILFINYLNQCPFLIIDYVAFLNEVIRENE